MNSLSYLLYALQQQGVIVTLVIDSEGFVKATVNGNSYLEVGRTIEENAFKAIIGALVSK